MVGKAPMVALAHRNSFYRAASNQDQKSDLQNGQAHNGEQAGGHELASLRGVTLAEEDRDHGPQPGPERGLAASLGIAEKRETRVIAFNPPQWRPGSSRSPARGRPPRLRSM
jgi:hypothetical protein